MEDLGLLPHLTPCTPCPFPPPCCSFLNWLILSHLAHPDCVRSSQPPLHRLPEPQGHPSPGNYLAPEREPHDVNLHASPSKDSTQVMSEGISLQAAILRMGIWSRTMRVPQLCCIWTSVLTSLSLDLLPRKSFKHLPVIARLR